MFATVPLVLLLAVAAIGQAGNAKAWDEGGFGPGHWGYFHHFWFHHWGCGDSCGVDQGQSIVNPCCDNQPDQGVCCYYNQGTGDVQNNLVSKPLKSWV